jgi:hypothetical protein
VADAELRATAKQRRDEERADWRELRDEFRQCYSDASGTTDAESRLLEELVQVMDQADSLDCIVESLSVERDHSSRSGEGDAGGSPRRPAAE